MLSNCVVTGSAKDIRRHERDLGHALEVGDTMQSSMLSLISSVPATPIIVADVTGAQ